MSAPLLDVTGLAVRRGTRDILRSVTFDAAPGELLALMGPSGSGKTTILRVIAGLDPFHDGRVSVGGVEIEASNANGDRAAAFRALRQKVGMVFQFHHLFEHLSVLDNVVLAPVHVQGAARSDAERRARELLRSLGVEHRADAWPRELSGGEAQRVAIARALGIDPQVLLLDEPTASLDPERRIELGEILRDLAGRGRLLVMATHDEEFASAFASRILRLRDGRLVDQE